MRFLLKATWEPLRSSLIRSGKFQLVKDWRCTGTVFVNRSPDAGLPRLGGMKQLYVHNSGRAIERFFRSRAEFFWLRCQINRVYHTGSIRFPNLNQRQTKYTRIVFLRPCQNRHAQIPPKYRCAERRYFCPACSASFVSAFTRPYLTTATFTRHIQGTHFQRLFLASTSRPAVRATLSCGRTVRRWRLAPVCCGSETCLRTRAATFQPTVNLTSFASNSLRTFVHSPVFIYS